MKHKRQVLNTVSNRFSNSSKYGFQMKQDTYKKSREYCESILNAVLILAK